MPHYSDYAKHGICRFENFPECLNNPLEMDLGEAGGVRWFMRLQKMTNEKFRGAMYFKNQNENFQVGFEMYFNYVNDIERVYGHGKHTVPPRTPIFFGRGIEVSEVCDHANSWLRDGSISIEYGIHVESAKLDEGIWKFNLKDTLFDPEKKIDKLTFTFDKSKDTEIHCTKQLLKFHSPVLLQHFSNEEGLCSEMIRMDNSYDYLVFHTCLQITHGVRLQLFEPHQISQIVEMAKKLKLQNVVRFCEQQLIEQQIWPVHAGFVCHKLTRYMMCSLKTVQYVEQFKQIYEPRDVEDMPSEIMRMILKKFMDNEF